MSMALTIVHPPTMRVLLEDDTFAKYMRRVPRLPDNLLHTYGNPPWLLWAEFEDGTWKRARVAEYRDAYSKMKRLLKNTKVRDVSLVSRRMMFAPPMDFNWQSRKFPWCARCRRPSMFRFALKHHAIEIVDYTFDEPYRCYYCSIRQVALPKHSPR